MITIEDFLKGKHMIEVLPFKQESVLRVSNELKSRYGKNFVASSHSNALTLIEYYEERLYHRDKAIFIDSYNHGNTFFFNAYDQDADLDRVCKIMKRMIIDIDDIGTELNIKNVTEEEMMGLIYGWCKIRRRRFI